MLQLGSPGVSHFISRLHQRRLAFIRNSAYQRVNAINGALIGGSVWVKNSPTVIATKVSYSPTSDSYLLIWEDQVDVPWPVYGLRLNGTAGFVGSSFHISNGA